MSDLLERAIADATALKEVAVKNAESILMEKYSAKIKEAVEQLLEQEPEEEDPNAEMVSDIPPEEMLGGSVGGEESAILDKIPMAVSNGEEDFAEEDEEIEIDFSELEKQLAGEKDLDASGLTDREDMASELPIEDGASMEDDIPNKDEIQDVDAVEDIEDIDEASTIEGSPAQEEISEEEIDENTLREIIEALEVDYDPKPDGWLGANDVDKAQAVEGILAKSQDDEYKDGLEAMKKALQEIEESNKKIQMENKELRQNLNSVIEKLNESNTINAKYLYMNKILREKSLNEKQKTIFVEHLSKSDSVDKAKVIYETLLGSMGASRGKTAPKSLNEVVSRPSMTSPIKPKLEKVISDPIMERMKHLAGIKG